MDARKILLNYGFSEEEARFYLAALELGESPLAPIAEKAGINRSTAYLVAKKLEQGGFVGSFRMKSGLKFVPSPPAMLLKQLERKAQEVKEILPELNAIEKNSQAKPKATLYEGEEGYFTILEETLKTEEKLIRNIGSLKKLYEIIGRKYDDQCYIPERVKNRIKFKGLFFEKEVKDFFTPERNAYELREIKFLPENYSHPVYIMIYGSCVATFTSKKELTVLKIESPEIAKSEKDKFDLLWKFIK